MTNSIAKRRRLSLIAVFAVVASVFVLPAVPASALAGTADDLATFSACPAGSAPASNFSDVSASSFAKSAIDCIKMFGVTQGTSATTYSPGDGVTRWQMALFLIRAARPSGITVPAAADQGFTDIADLPQSTQDAINQLKQLGIAAGTSATTFSPNDVVSRYQMALFLARFLDDVVVGPGGKDIALDVAPDDANFTDIAGVSYEAYNAIRNLFEMGVTTGTSATTFGPYDSVTREQMAAFIARALNHSNARPAGVWIQANPTSGFGGLSPNLSVSVRDSSFQPAANALVDVFEFEPSITVTSAFKVDGTCVTTGEVTAVGGSGVCAIAVTDGATNSFGNYSPAGAAVTAGKTATYYAWTGSAGATFDNDITASSNVSVVSSPAAAGYLVTSTIPTNAAVTAGSDKIVKYGSSVTITVQLVDSVGNPVARAAQNVIFTNTVYTDAAESATASINSTTVATDATGKATFTITQADPTIGDDTDIDQTVAIGGVFSATSVQVEWQDGAAAVTTLILSQDSDYTVAALAGATHTAKGSVYDQYGNPVNNIGVQFSNNDELTTPTVMYTNSSGVATVSWTRADATAEADTLSGVADVDADGNFTVAAGEAIADSGDLNVYWAVELAAASSGGVQPVLVWDGANDTIVYGTTSPTLVKYDSNDQFNAGGPVTYAVFDAAVNAEPVAGTYVNVNVTTYATSASGVSSFTLS